MKFNNFYLEDYHVDVSRNQISNANETHTLPPKTIALLCELAKKQGEVVSNETLMANVWPGRVVSANSLQRCISQLRKALNDDAQTQIKIKTHSKKGYSLELKVRMVKTLTGRVTSRAWYQGYLSLTLVTLVGLLIIAGLTLFNRDPVDTQTAVTISPITSSDDWEGSASYDPKGEFIVFRRFIDNCNSHIWLKDLNKHTEQKLTQKPAVYGQPNWSIDGTQLTFSKRNQCQQNAISQPNCWSINTLNVLDALQSPQMPIERLACNNNPSWQAKWLANGDIGFLTEQESASYLKRHSPKSDTLVTVFMQPDHYAYSYDYSEKNRTFAILTLTQKNKHMISIVRDTGELLSQAEIKLPSQFTQNTAFQIAYHPNGDALMISAQGYAFTLSKDGSVKKMDIGGKTTLSELSFHPKENKYLATEIIADTDIALIKTDVLNQTFLELDLHAISRSNLNDDNAKFQPHGDLIAFTSSRTGKRQLWVFDGVSKQLSNSKYGLQSKHILWSPEGNEIAGIAVNKLQIWQLNGAKKTVETKHLITSLHQWFDKDTLLVNTLVNGHHRLFSLNLRTGHMTDLNISNVMWATYTQDKTLLYYDNQGKFKLENKGHSEIPQLANQLEQPYAVYKGEMLYGLNPKRELWRYSLSDNSLEIIARFSDSSRYVSDVNQGQLLITHMHQLKKDLVLIEVDNSFY